MARRSRAQQKADEKAAAGAGGGYMTSGDLCTYLNLAPRAFRARLFSGRIPPPHIRSPQGWGLWSPEQCKALLAQELERKRK